MANRHLESPAIVASACAVPTVSSANLTPADFLPRPLILPVRALVIVQIQFHIAVDTTGKIGRIRISQVAFVKGLRVTSRMGEAKRLIVTNSRLFEHARSACPPISSTNEENEP